jgi:hypothetical protein
MNDERRSGLFPFYQFIISGSISLTLAAGASAAGSGSHSPGPGMEQKAARGVVRFTRYRHFFGILELFFFVKR